jgi:hypothetical protein
MPQLIAMVIVVVGAMIYMFQTFGGTGDKIEGIAQKTSVITEINNVKNGLKLAARGGNIAATTNTTNEVYSNLQGLASIQYFAEQINTQLTKQSDGTARTLLPNVYSAISFSGTAANAGSYTGDMLIQLVATKDKTPGIFVDLSKGKLKDGAGFLESQIANDLNGVAIIVRGDTATAAGAVTASTTARTTGTAGENARIPADSASPALSDGMFTIYFKDFGSTEVVK